MSNFWRRTRDEPRARITADGWRAIISVIFLACLTLEVLALLGRL